MLGSKLDVGSSCGEGCGGLEVYLSFASVAIVGAGGAAVAGAPGTLGALETYVP